MVTKVDNVKENRNKNIKTQNTYDWSEKECKSWYITWLKNLQCLLYHIKHQILIFNFRIYLYTKQKMIKRTWYQV